MTTSTPGAPVMSPVTSTGINITRNTSQHHMCCSYSFFLNPDWSQNYSKQPEILAYLQRAAARKEITIETTERFEP